MWLDVVQIWKRSFSICILFLGFFLFTEGALLAADKGNVPAGLDVYSSVNFIELEREFVGLQIVVVSYVEEDARKQKVLWRSAGPFLNPPLLLDAVPVGKNLRVVVPDGDSYSGSWNLTLRGNSMIASGPDPVAKGQEKQVITLKKLAVK
jgi:hypothetical protein